MSEIEWDGKTYDDPIAMLEDIKREMDEENMFSKLKHIPFRVYRYINDIFHEIYWAYQRVRYGCDYRVGWDLSNYIVEMMPRWIDLVNESRCGISMDYYEGFTPNSENMGYTDEEDAIASQRFTDTLEKIKNAFIVAKEMNDNYQGKEKHEEQLKIFNEGFELFQNIFGR